MDINEFSQTPTAGATYAKNGVPPFTITTQNHLLAILSVDGVEVFQGSYGPNLDGKITIDFEGLYDEYLSTTIPDWQTSLQQPCHRRLFTAEFHVIIGEENPSDNNSISWFVANARMNPAPSFGQWILEHFLTNQPTEKRTTEGCPEWITYYSPNKSYKLIARVYPTTGGHTNVLLDSGSDGVLTHPVSCKTIKKYLMPSTQLKGYYDIMLVAGNTILASQRYIVERTTGLERYFFFVNALGGIDTLICRGENTLQPEVTFNTGRIGGLRLPLRDTNDIRTWQQALRFPWRQRDWIHELLTEKQAAALIAPDGITQQAIVVTGMELSAGNREQLSTASFTYIKSGNDLPGEGFHEDKGDLALSSIRSAQEITVRAEEEESLSNYIIDYTRQIEDNTLSFETESGEGRIHIEGTGDITLEVSVDGETYTPVVHGIEFSDGVAIVPFNLFTGDFVRLSATTLTVVIVNYNTSE